MIPGYLQPPLGGWQRASGALREREGRPRRKQKKQELALRVAGGGGRPRWRGAQPTPAPTFPLTRPAAEPWRRSSAPAPLPPLRIATKLLFTSATVERAGPTTHSRPSSASSLGVRCMTSPRPENRMAAPVYADVFLPPSLLQFGYRDTRR